ncbi:MAG: hypothetical protein PHN77_22245, partial [Thermoguttaceae bacterium]|nr:hypothetical protein [Thermoguttaceae bacterium]
MKRTGKMGIALASALALAIGASRSPVDHARAAQTSPAKAAASSAEAVKADGSAFTIEMSKEQFQQFTRNRAALRERLDRHLRFHERRADRPLICVKHPDGREPLVALSLKFHGFGPASGVLAEFRDAWRYFPEIVEIDASTCRFDAVPDDVIKEFASLPHLRTLILAGGNAAFKISEEAIKILARYAELERLSLGNCRISAEEFAHLENLKTLRSISLGGGVTPQCFITLAKLPDFCEFVLVGGTPEDNQSFARAIDEETHLAIVSLNGRLKRFAAREHTFPLVHGSILRALGEVKSLEILDLDGAMVCDVALEDAESLPGLVNLRHFD